MIVKTTMLTRGTGLACRSSSEGCRGRRTYHPYTRVLVRFAPILLCGHGVGNVTGERSVVVWECESEEADIVFEEEGQEVKHGGKRELQTAAIRVLYDQDG